MSLIDLLAEVEATLASVSCVNNGSPEYLTGLQTTLDAAKTRAGVVRRLGDSMLGAVGDPAKFAAGLNPLQLIVNVSNLVAVTAAVPFLLGMEAQLGSMINSVNSIEASTQLPIQGPNL